MYGIENMIYGQLNIQCYESGNCHKLALADLYLSTCNYNIPIDEECPCFKCYKKKSFKNPKEESLNKLLDERNSQQSTGPAPELYPKQNKSS